MDWLLRVVLVSEHGEAMSSVIRMICEDGGRAVHVVADVTQMEGLRKVKSKAIEKLGQVDTWVNHSGVGI